VKPWLAVLVFILLLIVVAAGLFKVGQQYPIEAVPPATVATTPEPAPVAAIEPSPEPTLAAPVPIVFKRDGLNARIIHEVETVCGSNNSQVAVLESERGRWVCIVVAEERRFYSLDGDWRLQNFPALQRIGFIAPSPPVLKTMSIYRSVAKTAMQYNAAAGDRIIVLLCDRGGMLHLKLDWPTE